MRYSRAYQVDFYLFDAHGHQLGGGPVDLPGPIHEDVTRHDAIGPDLRQAHSEAEEMRQSGDLSPPGQSRWVSFTTSDPTLYWHVMRMLTFDEGQDEPLTTRLIVRSDSFYGHGLFFDPRPWILGAVLIIIISILFWLPLIRGITRSIGEMTGAAQRIANEDFSIRVDDERTDELGSLGASINHLASRLAGYVSGQKRFLGDISHELNSPLARMQFALSILEENARPEDRAHIDDVREEVDLMTRLVRELLSYSQSGLQAASVRFEAVGLRELVDAVVARECRTVPPPIKVSVEPDLIVKAQPELLYRAMANVIRNSLAYSNGDGQIAVVGSENGGKVTVTVSDNGPGVPDDMLEKIFDPLFRVQNDRSRDTGGTGLGLAIVRTCVEACGGKVSARNRTPSGLEIEIALEAPGRAA
jgi:two-component system sensor histidine kinase CpxA